MIDKDKGAIRFFPLPKLREWVFNPEVPENVRPGMTGTLSVRSDVLFRPERLYVVGRGVHVLEVKIGGKVQRNHEQYKGIFRHTYNVFRHMYNVLGLFDTVEIGDLVEFYILFEEKVPNAVALTGPARIE